MRGHEEYVYKLMSCKNVNIYSREKVIAEYKFLNS